MDLPERIRLQPPKISDQSLATLSLLHWLMGQDQLAATVGLKVDAAELAAAILTRTFTMVEDYSDLADAALILKATRSIVDRTIQSSIEEAWRAPVNAQDAVRLVTTICDRFPIVANTLKERYDNRETLTIKDEYDVQDLLGALLKLHFDDVRPEEWTPVTPEIQAGSTFS